MKSILMSIKPKWVEKIASGEKTVEVRKSVPKCGTPFKCYIYATKSGDRLVLKENAKGDTTVYEINKNLCGKVVGEFVCDEVIEICFECSDWSKLRPAKIPYIGLTDKEIVEYLGNGKSGYGLHISELKIYDKPKALSEFDKPCSHECIICDYYYGGSLYEPPSCNCEDAFMLTRPPQSWCYVEEL